MGRAFTLTDRQEAEFKVWQEKIKDIFGEYGHYDFTFTGYGVGTSLIVKSHLTGTSLDLSHEEDW